MTNAPGAEVILLLKERADKTISGSVRTTSPAADASAIAEMFGGGGHGQAAGFRIQDGNFRQHEAAIIDKIRQYQSERLGVMEEPQEEIKETPIIDVQKLLNQVKEAEKAQEAMPSKEDVKKYSFKPTPPKHRETKVTTPGTIPGVTYKFED